jgi:CPA1 family monovalent cation:H+ antiporter
MFKNLGLKGRLRLLVESESLFNDGVAAVLFALALSWAMIPGSAPPGLLPAAGAFMAVAGGGLAVGIIVGGAALLLVGRAADRLVGTALTTVAAYGSFFLAEHFHFSGVLASVAAGLLMGNVAILGKVRPKIFSIEERDFIVTFWDFAAFLANSVVFLLIGLTVASIPFARLGMKALAMTIGLVLLGRLMAVYPLSLIFARTRWAIPVRDQHVLWWGGLRGALALALALSLPSGLAFAREIQIATFGVVAFSVVLQGLTMPMLLRVLGHRV